MRENEFRSRWADYQVDRPQQAAAAQPEDTENADSGGLLSAFGQSFQNYFRTGPFQLRAGFSAGWEFTNEEALRQINPHGSENSAFLAPAFGAFYNVAQGGASISARYSAGYVYYLDPSYLAVSHNGGIFSQSTGLDVSFEGSRATIRSSTSGSYGDGDEIESGTFRTRSTIAEAVDATYLPTNFTRLGSSGALSYASYSGGGATTISDLSYSGTLYGDYVITGKSRVRLELGAGGDHQDADGGIGNDRAYEQILFKFGYGPSDKLAVEGGVGVGVQQDNGPVDQASGVHAIYTMTGRYAPTERTFGSLHFGYGGTDIKPDFSVLLQSQPRPNTGVGVSAYQANNYSTYLVSQNLTTRGFLGTIKQKILDRVEVDVSSGIEETRGYIGRVAGEGNHSPPYYFGSVSVLWQFSPSLALQSYYRGFAGAAGSVNPSNNWQSRAAISLRLTF